MHISSRLPGVGCEDSTTCMLSKNCSSPAVAGATSTVADLIVGGSVGEETVAFPPGATVVSIEDGRLACAAGATSSVASSAAQTTAARDAGTGGS